MKAALIVLAASFIAAGGMLILMTLAKQPKSMAEHLQEIYNRNKKDAKKASRKTTTF